MVERKLHVNNSLLTALVDRWRPETHTFHLPCGEMAPTLQDVSMLLGLPVSGRVVTPTAKPNKDWREHLLQRFRGVLPESPDKPYEFVHSYGIPFSWLCQFKVTTCIDVISYR
jgi:hypothetical protein